MLNSIVAAYLDAAIHVLHNLTVEVQACPYTSIGHALDIDLTILNKSLISLALPTGIEPVFQP